MPYIPWTERGTAVSYPLNAGQLNYAISRIIWQYLDRHGMSYQYANDCLGALEGAKQELYRRVIAPYEDEKIRKNGDVYV